MLVGIEHRFRGDHAQDAWNLLGKTGDDAKVTKEGDDVGWCTSGGVVVAVANHVTAVSSTMGGQVESTEESEGRIAEAWVKCQEEMHVFAVYFWCTDDSTSGC